MLGQEKDFRLGSNSLYFARGFQAVHAGHGNIQDYNVGLKLFCVSHRVGAVGGIADNGKVRFGAKECADGLASERVVINDEDVVYAGDQYQYRSGDAPVELYELPEYLK